MLLIENNILHFPEPQNVRTRVPPTPVSERECEIMRYVTLRALDDLGCNLPVVSVELACLSKKL